MLTKRSAFYFQYRQHHMLLRRLWESAHCSCIVHIRSVYPQTAETQTEADLPESTEEQHQVTQYIVSMHRLIVLFITRPLT